MNQKARALGLENTHFENPHGLDTAGHFASARDLTKLLGVALEDPLVRRYTRMSSAVLSNGVRVESTDNLIHTVPGFQGGKTGHTFDAGWSQVAAVKRDGVTLTAAVLGDPDEAQRDADLAALLRYGLTSFRLSRVVDPSARVRQSGRRLGSRPGRHRRPAGGRPARGRPTGAPSERVVAPVVADAPVAEGPATRLGDDSRRVEGRDPRAARRGPFASPSRQSSRRPGTLPGAR